MKIQTKGFQWIAGVTVLALLPIVAAAETPQERIDQAMARAKDAGIPIELLESKVAEGRAKGIAADRIATAVENRLHGLEQAKLIMTRGANDVDAAQLSVGADAISAGVGETVLEKIAASTGRDRRTVAVAALTQLVLHGMTPEAAFLRVKEALARGPQALANLAAQPGAAAEHKETVRGAIPSTADDNRAARSPTPSPRPANAPPGPPVGRGVGRGAH